SRAVERALFCADDRGAIDWHGSGTEICAVLDGLQHRGVSRREIRTPGGWQAHRTVRGGSGRKRRREWIAAGSPGDAGGCAVGDCHKYFRLENCPTLI